MCSHEKYNSKTQSEYIEIKAPYVNAIRDTKIYFENEKIVVFVNSLGHFEFYDEGENSLGFVDVPVSKDPSEKGHTAQYGSIRCVVEDKNICIYAPVYGWEDYYPHCDGESDRWNRYIARWFKVIFNCDSHKITILDR